VGGLIPLLLFSEGSFWPPLAVVIAGGVGFSVILSLVFTPTIVAAFKRNQHKRLVSE
jgi:multidrug efflux pump subunit AcrB